MRIERVVADSFHEASEQTKKRYGKDCLVLSTHKVGNITELLVCVDPIEDTNFGNTFSAEPTAGFRAVIEDEMTAPSLKNKHKVENGSALVSVIREELHALEVRLATTGSGTALARAMMGLLEQGVSAVYAKRLLAHDKDLDAMAKMLVNDLGPASLESLRHREGLAVVGPAGSGKTTLAMQLTLGLDNHSPSRRSVSAMRDLRPGTRERFFGLADSANLEAQWGNSLHGATVIDSGGLNIDEIRALNFSGGYVLCLPAHFTCNAAVRWLRAGLKISGVVVTHWNSQEQPLGLLCVLAEHGAPLCGVSTSSDPAAPVLSIDPINLHKDVKCILQLALHK